MAPSCDIWLGVRTVPVLYVAKEVAAPASRVAHWPRSARTATGRRKRTDCRSSAKKLFSFVYLLMFFSLLEVVIEREMPVACSKLTCSAKVKKLAWYLGSEIDDRSWPLSLIVRVLRGRVRLARQSADLDCWLPSVACMSSPRSSSKEHTTRPARTKYL